MFSKSYLNSAETILSLYHRQEPFHLFLHKYFKQHKKFGSRDRKYISDLCYCFFRTGKALQELDMNEKMIAGFFLCSTKPSDILAELKPGLDESMVSLPLKKKLSDLSNLIPGITAISSREIFPWIDQLSDEIHANDFILSHFVQPDLFLRIRPGYETLVKSKLTGANIFYNEINSNCLSLANRSKIDDVIILDKEAVVQDLSSQKTGEIFSFFTNPTRPIKAWDCCAASGGKSIMLYDMIPGVDLTVSDIRKSILINLEKRFAKAGIKKYRPLVVDLTKDLQHFMIDGERPTANQPPFDLIICDAPCSGSGTWSRTPEQLYFFEENKIEYYSSLQRKIVSNAIPFLKKKGRFIYITCSVFKKENEEIVDFIKNNFPVELKQMEIIKGYDKKADTMFVALFEKG